MNFLQRIDLPGFDHVELGEMDCRFAQRLERELNRFLGTDDVCIVGDDITISSLRNEDECGYFDITYEDIDKIYFRSGCGILFALFFSLFRKHGMIPGLGGYDADTYIEMEMCAIDEEDDEDRTRESVSMIKSYRLSERRFEALSYYLGLDINFREIVEILRAYDQRNGTLKGFDSGNGFLQELADLLEKTIDFFETVDRVLPFAEEYNFPEMLVWFGNDAQRDYNEYMYDETVGGGDGFYIHYKGVEYDSYPIVNKETVEMWKQARKAGIPSKPLMETYSEILKKLYDAEFIKEFARIPDKGHLCAVLYGKLAGTGRGRKGRYQKWESIGDASSFSELFIGAYRDGLRKPESQPSGDPSDPAL